MSKPRQLHRVLSVLLCLCMLAGMLPAYARPRTRRLRDPLS